MIPYLGEAAALGAACSWAIASLFLTRAGRGLGSQVVNGARLPLAAAVLLIIHWAATGAPWPAGLTGDQTWWLLVSGMAAHVVGDGLLYSAYVLVGPRLSLLVGTSILSSPPSWPGSFWARPCRSGRWPARR